MRDRSNPEYETYIDLNLSILTFLKWKMNMWCPSCNKSIEAQAVMCTNCKADFSNPDGWKPISDKATGAARSIVPTSEVIKTTAKLGLGLVFTILIIFGVLFAIVMYTLITQGLGH